MHQQYSLSVSPAQCVRQHFWCLLGQCLVSCNGQTRSIKPLINRICDMSLRASRQHHVAVVWDEDAGTVVVYRDGAQYGTSSPLPPSNPRIPLGAHVMIGAPSCQVGLLALNGSGHKLACIASALACQLLSAALSARQPQEPGMQGTIAHCHIFPGVERHHAQLHRRWRLRCWPAPRWRVHRLSVRCTAVLNCPHRATGLMALPARRARC
jgi:hypothetical protein